MIALDSKISTLYRAGQKLAKTLQKLGLETVRDLLFHFPSRYEDFRESLAIDSLEAGMEANIRGTIELISNKRSAKRRMYLTEALISDNSGSVKAIWFNQPFLTRNLKVGDRVSLAGRVSESYGQLALVSPQYEKIYSDDLVHTKGLVPDYRLTADLSQKQLRSLIKQALPLAAEISDWLPERTRNRLGLLELKEALQKIHFPKSLEEAEEARRRLSFGELFLRQLRAQAIKNELKSKQAPAVPFREKETKEFVASLPFKLTDSQRRAAWEILQDMEKEEPMSRLLEGDVGSGKTVVATIALLNAALSGRQAALMAPTEILANQHYQLISKLLGSYGFNIALLTGSRKSPQAADANIVIGTQALIQKNFKFHDLALVIVDEQHRFGVKQRQHLLDYQANERELTPHFLSMTATPIPRSLALAIYGDLDLSIINQLPAGRKAIETKIILENERTAAYDFIRKEISSGRQAFVVCPLIDESDRLGVKSVKAEHEKLDRLIFPDLQVGLLHGRLKTKEKEAVMADFLAGKTQILVSTAVIEVGVDVPNATLMIIEGAERFGLATLHQFRGRVGRSHYQSYCLLFPSDSGNDNQKTLTRLEAMVRHQDGFALARIDLKLRGAGDIYGASQSGFPELQLASLFDYENIKKAQEEATAIIGADPQLSRYPQLKAELGKWESAIHLE